jgi:Protein of unknown function (DUF2934)
MRGPAASLGRRSVADLIRRLGWLCLWLIARHGLRVWLTASTVVGAVAAHPHAPRFNILLDDRLGLRRKSLADGFKGLEVTMPRSQGRRPNDFDIAPIVEQLGDVPQTEIARRAYELYEQRGGADGHDIDDWLLAERELRLAGRSTAA